VRSAKPKNYFSPPSRRDGENAQETNLVESHHAGARRYRKGRPPARRLLCADVRQRERRESARLRERGLQADPGRVYVVTYDSTVYSFGLESEQLQPTAGGMPAQGT